MVSDGSAPPWGQPQVGWAAVLPLGFLSVILAASPHEALSADTRVHTLNITETIKLTMVCAPTSECLGDHPPRHHTHLQQLPCAAQTGSCREVFMLPAALVSPADLCGYSLHNDLLFSRLYLYSRNHALNLE